MKRTDQEKIIKMLLGGETISSVMRECGIAQSTVAYYRKKLGLFHDSNKYKYIDWDAVQVLHDSGMNKEDIAKELSVSKNLIDKAIKSKKIVYRRNSRHGKQKDNKCLFCKSKTNAAKYCSIECRTKYEREEKIKKWKSGEISGSTGEQMSILGWLRDYILEKYNYKCSECGFSGVNKKTGNSIIQIDHIDGNPANTAEENLRALCPNCHSMTETYMSLNAQNKNRVARKRK